MRKQSSLDLGQLALGNDDLNATAVASPEPEQAENAIALAAVHSRAITVSNADIVWMEATRGLQNNLIRWKQRI